jgi:hypothetical protein
MADAQKGDLVQIHKIVLEPSQRPDTLPACTKAVPYECWIKGFLLNENSNIGDEVNIKTLVGRELRGMLCSVNPTYDNHFGVPQKELLSIGEEAREILNRRRGQ